QAEDGIRDLIVTGVQTCALPIFLNLAQSGATTADLLHGPLGKAMEMRPQLITLGIGGNDLWRLVPANTFEENLERIGDGLEQTRSEERRVGKESRARGRAEYIGE